MGRAVRTSLRGCGDALNGYRQAINLLSGAAEIGLRDVDVPDDSSSVKNAVVL